MATRTGTACAKNAMASGRRNRKEGQQQRVQQPLQHTRAHGHGHGLFWVLSILLVVCLSSAGKVACEVEGDAAAPATVRGSVQLRDGTVDPASVRVVLKQGRPAHEDADGIAAPLRTAYLKVPSQYYEMPREEVVGGRVVPLPQGDFDFAFEGVPPGTHLLEVLAIGLAFPQVRLDVSDGALGSSVFDASPSDRVTASLVSDPTRFFRSPLRIAAMGTMNYFEQRSNLFSLKTLLANPMYLIMGIMTLAILFVPKLIDKDAIEQMQREMAEQQQQAQQQSQQRQEIKRE
eukprot:CAMPEP_0198238042 /NCGR_PEP_ID=MMETSP1446-20131203/3768_1 /TAXON_ID=1461542 ORGANISM="Unidentified sp, Strain CCMP2111" /NCGR_SAMPLE_ID=MMETSP1446 /ASSEMBLY_ACC=CAM_ASM_001112 /LENGTH=288 /DNA_ID=CAMNT_0043920359 /DNA_START=65 /DNA_END=931 /DNA_ORIENTATION=+